MKQIINELEYDSEKSTLFTNITGMVEITYGIQDPDYYHNVPVYYELYNTINGRYFLLKYKYDGELKRKNWFSSHYNFIASKKHPVEIIPLTKQEAMIEFLEGKCISNKIGLGSSITVLNKSINPVVSFENAFGKIEKA